MVGRAPAEGLWRAIGVDCVSVCVLVGVGSGVGIGVCTCARAHMRTRHMHWVGSVVVGICAHATCHHLTSTASHHYHALGALLCSCVAHGARAWFCRNRATKSRGEWIGVGPLSLASTGARGADGAQYGWPCCSKTRGGVQVSPHLASKSVAQNRSDVCLFVTTYFYEAARRVLLDARGGWSCAHVGVHPCARQPLFFRLRRKPLLTHGVGCDRALQCHRMGEPGFRDNHAGRSTTALICI